MQICDICQKEYKNVNLHFWRVHGPGVSHRPNSGNPAWNKGLTKETNAIVASSALAISISNKGKPGHPCSEETKKKISESRKKFLEENPHMVPYLLNHSSRVSYPETYFRDCFSKYEHIVAEHRVGLYSLDFANVKKLIYFEVDGEQHYVDKKIVESDLRRTAYLNNLGWVGYRCRWSEFQKMNDADRHLYVQKIIGSIA